jgi:hypothetical protein
LTVIIVDRMQMSRRLPCPGPREKLRPSSTRPQRS